ncbi:MAG: flagellar hook-associated protein FlgK [Syntrophales bacterium]|nr:flagellar hook-associated protein FlgK [Syntrophales bacterium]
MTTLSSIMNTTLNTLQTQQAAIAVTSSNIANVNTDGYTRQSVVISASSSGTTAGSKRVYDKFLTNQLNSANQALGEYTAKAKYLDSIEVVFDESEGSGLSEAMSDFWGAWQDLVGNPSGSSERSVLASSADNLSGLFNSMSSDLSEIQERIDDDVVTTVDAINEDVEQIAGLNQKIAQALAAGQDASTYQDSLDVLVSDLSTLVNIKTHTNNNGQTCIQLTNGTPLVEGATSWSLSTQTNTSSGLKDVTWLDRSGNATVITDAVSGGELGGELEVRDESIPAYQDQLDELAVSIMDAINVLHTSGYDLNGDAGVSFFVGTGAADVAVNSVILDDHDLIVAASRSAEASSNGSIATAIAELQDSLTLDEGTSTFSDYYSALVAKIGTAVQTADSQYSAQSDAVDLYKNLRDAVASVSLDEEQTKLLMYQNAFAAAAKVMTVLDELLQTVIEM